MRWPPPRFVPLKIMRDRPLPNSRLALLAVILTTQTASVVAQSQPDLFDPNVVRSYYLTFKQSNWWTLLGQNKRYDRDIKADLQVGSITLKDIGVRFKGNTSYSYNPSSQKKPFNLRFDAFVPDQDLFGYEHINLQNAYKDATFVREPITYEIMRRYIPSLKSCWIKLYLNNQYWGIYVIVQQPNKRFLGEHFAAKDGNLYRGDNATRSSRPVFRYWGTSISSYSSRYEYKSVGNPNPWTDLIDFCRVLNNTTIVDLPKKLPPHLDVDEALWYIALNNIFVNTDSYLGTGNDYYAYSDPRHGRFQIMPWDLNTTFGGYDWGRILGTNRHLMKIDYSGGSSLRPMIERLLAVPQYRERYHAHYRTMLDEFFDWKVLGPIVAKYQKLIEDGVKADTKKLYATQLFFDNAIKDVRVSDRYGTYTVPGLKSFVDKRRAYLLSLTDIKKVAPTLSGLARKPLQPKLTDTVWVTAKVTGQAATAVTLYSRTSGAWTETKMWDDGNHQDGVANDGTYGASIPHKRPGYEVQYYVGATATSGAVRFLPSHAGVGAERYRLMPTPFSSPIRINEVLADNDSVDKDPAGDFEDWVELYNTTNAAIDISGYYLSDRFDNPKAYKFPVNTVIPARGFYRVWCDQEPTEGPDHADFKLAKDGEQVALFSSDVKGVEMLDALIYPDQRSDTSFGFVPDGGNVSYFLYDPKGKAPVTGVGAGTAARYDRRQKGSAQGFTLGFLGDAVVGKVFSIELAGATANSTALLAFGAGPAAIDLGLLGTLNINPNGMIIIGLTVDNTGSRSYPNSVPASAAGFTVYAQAISSDLSNAMAIRFTK